MERSLGLNALLATLFDTTGGVDTYDRDLAVRAHRRAQRAQGWKVTGGQTYDEDGRALYWIAAEPPLCDGGCGGRTGSPVRMCYQCQCEAHADGWYDHDTGYVRM